ncbi:MAG: zinc-ribbon domain-containing protein [bacterium]|nr:zinc-ribbon domain-containing protein [bacterium]
MGKVCKICGKENQDNSKFCGNCGSPLSLITEEKVQKLSSDTHEKTGGSLPEKKPQKKRDDSLTIIKVVIFSIFGIIILCLLSVLGMIVYESIDGGFNIDTQPSAAELTIQGVYNKTFTTPAKIRDLKKERSYMITIKKEGYKTRTEWVTATLFPKDYLYVLELALGDVIFITEEPGYEIFVDNVNTGKMTPSKIKDIPVGKHFYILKKVNEKDITGEITVIEGELTQFNTVTGSNVYFNEDVFDHKNFEAKPEKKVIKVKSSEMSLDTFSNSEKSINPVHDEIFNDKEGSVRAEVFLDSHKADFKIGDNINFNCRLFFRNTSPDETKTFTGNVKFVVLDAKDKTVLLQKSEAVNMPVAPDQFEKEFEKTFTFSLKIENEYKMIIQVFWEESLLNESVTPVLITPLKMKDFYITYDETKTSILHWGEVNYANVILEKKASPYDAEFIFNIMRKGRFLLLFNAPYGETSFKNVLKAENVGEYHYVIPFVPDIKKKHKSQGYLFDVIIDQSEIFSSSLYP